MGNVVQRKVNGIDILIVYKEDCGSLVAEVAAVVEGRRYSAEVYRVDKCGGVIIDGGINWAAYGSVSAEVARTMAVILDEAARIKNIADVTWKNMQLLRKT